MAVCPRLIVVPMVPRALLLSALLTLLPVAIGVGVSGDATLTREQVPYRGTALADFDTRKAVVQRAPFCDLVPDAAVAEAIGKGATLTRYDNGEQSDAFPSGDVAHEYGCRYAPEDGGVEARGWVFAPPVTAASAEQLVAAVPTGCTPLPEAAAFGTPSGGVQCALDGGQTISYRGLFGDAWLACSLTLPVDVPGSEAVDRAGRWCVAVAQAAATPLT